MVSVPFPNNGQNKNFKKDFNSENAGLVKILKKILIVKMLD